MFNNLYYPPKDKHVEVTDINAEGNDSHLITFNQRKSVISKSPNNSDNPSLVPMVKSQLKETYDQPKLTESSISRTSQRPNNQQQL